MIFIDLAIDVSVLNCSKFPMCAEFPNNLSLSCCKQNPGAFPLLCLHIKEVPGFLFLVYPPNRIDQSCSEKELIFSIRIIIASISLKLSM